MTTLPDTFPDRTVCIVGLGYVGLTLATTMTEVGFEVYGIEKRADIVEQLEHGLPPFHEPGMADRLSQAVQDKQLKPSTNIPMDCPATVYLIAVGTPLDEKGRVRTEFVERVTHEIAGVLRDGDMVVVRSTVKVGTTRSLILPILESSGRSFDLAFCPERTQEARALEELRQLPQIVAGTTHDSDIRAAQLFQLVTPTVVRVSDIETAEMIKMVDNAHRDVHFAFANEVARMCDAFGISAAEVIKAGKLGYPRTNLPMPGPVGGPCLTKDPYILAESLESYGIEPEITMTARRLNERQPKESIAYVREVCNELEKFPDDPVIAFLGIAFKGQPPTSDLRGTTARIVLDSVRKSFSKATLRGYDAMVSPGELRDFGLEPSTSLEEAFAGANIVLILNNHPTFAAMPLEELAVGMAKPGLVYDFWNLFINSHLPLPVGIGYAALGSHGRLVLPRPHE